VCKTAAVRAGFTLIGRELHACCPSHTAESLQNPRSSKKHNDKIETKPDRASCRSDLGANAALFRAPPLFAASVCKTEAVGAGFTLIGRELHACCPTHTVTAESLQKPQPSLVQLSMSSVKHIDKVETGPDRALCRSDLGANAALSRAPPLFAVWV